MEALNALVREILERENVLLIKLVIKNALKNPLIQVYADTVAGITSDELAALNRKISKALDESGLVQGSYRLDVSSPGIERPLEHLWQYRRNIGRDLEVTVEEEGESRIVHGTLREADAERIVLEGKKEERTLPMASVRKAVVRLRF
jgi:ribosome maturation factor RimP